MLEALRDVVDPELGINVVDLGLVYGVDVDAERIATIDMTLTSAACPLTDVIEDQAREALDGVVADFRINWVWMPPWGPENITDDGREQLRALGFNAWWRIRINWDDPPWAEHITDDGRDSSAPSASTSRSDVIQEGWRSRVVKNPAAGGGRWVEVPPERLVSWIVTFAQRHGGAAPIGR